MRNLKKFLALVMAMVMAFSLMVSANAATTGKQYNDANDVDPAFEEAVDVLTGMKVFSGDGDSFYPARNITRGEVAAIIYRLATGDTGTDKKDLYTTTHPFTDVNESDWFAPYVGYCWNAGYIKGTTATTFNPNANVTGYEVLAMILRAMGYDKNNEFTGNNWIINVSSTATQRGLLADVKSTHYGNTLHLASRRDVVASILFKAAQATRVVYTPAFGYQSGDHTSDTITDLYNDYSSLGWLNFGLVSTDKGVVIGNQQTGEDNTRLGFAGWFDVEVYRGNGRTVLDTTTPVPGFDADGSPTKNVYTNFKLTQYAWEGEYKADTIGTITGTKIKTTGGADLDQADDKIILKGNNDIFNVDTGVQLMGHRVKIWFDGRDSKFNSSKGHPTYAYFDKAKTEVVKADNTDLTNTDTDDKTTLAEAIDGSSLDKPDTAVFNNSFGKFGTLDTTVSAKDDTDADEVNLVSGDGVALDGYKAGAYTNTYASAVKLYEIIDNNDDKVVDAVIALNIESSQITESNAVNRVPTIGLPVYNWAVSPEAPATGSFFIEGVKATAGSATLKDDNLKAVPNASTGVITGVLAKDALKGNSVSALGDYEMGIHITGTNRRNISDNEATAINSAGTKNELESSYFLLHEVKATVEGKVVAYNRTAGTVTLDNGTVLNRSKFYDTVVVKNPKNGNATPGVSSTIAPDSAIPQGWVYDSSATDDPALDKWVEGYANTTYKFYTDYEGKYLGAERTYGASFLYGTYLDYEQKTSSSTFNYYLTGVTLNGDIETVQVNSYWWPNNHSNATETAVRGTDTFRPQSAVDVPENVTKLAFTGTDNLGVPYRDTYSAAATSMNGLGKGIYTGVTIQDGTVDQVTADFNLNRNEYLANMARLGIKYAAYLPVSTNRADMDVNPAFDIREIDIDNDAITLGARETINGKDLNNNGTGTGGTGSDTGLLGTAADAEYAGGTKTSNKYFTEATKFILVEGFGTDSVKAEVYNGISELKGNSAHVFIKMNGNAAFGGTPTDTKIKINDAWAAESANLMTYYTESPYTYAQSGQTAMKIDTIILPKAAVSWSGGSGLYYVGNPGYSMINSWGTDAWKYDLYEDGELKQVWLTNDPSNSTALVSGTNDDTYNLQKDSFYNLKDTGKKANDGQPIYTAGNYSTAGVWSGGACVSLNPDPTAVGKANQYTMTNGATATGVRYSAVTRDAQTATFVTFDGTADAANEAQLYRVAGAKVVNLNKGAGASGTLANWNKSASGEIWPGITDLTTLNEAGSISPVTGRALKVAAVVDPANELVVTTIYVCWDQSW